MSHIAEVKPAVHLDVHLDQIAQVALTVSDLARAKHFFQNVLGMHLLFEAGSMVFFQCGAIRLMIGTPEQPGPRGGTILYFKVDDLNQTHASLEQQGVSFLQPPHLVAKMPDHDLWMAFLKDPDENVFALMSELPQA